MFNKELISSDKFLDMPVSSQLLFFHLGMNADDDGFVSSPRRIQRTVGCSEDDIKVLIGKNFVVGFESGVIVISEWGKHNQNKKRQIHRKLYIQKKNKRCNSLILNRCNQMATKWQPVVASV